MEITVDHTKSAVITAQLAQEQCKVLIDTGAARCCIREDYYNKLLNVPLELLKNVRIRSATGRDLQTLRYEQYLTKKKEELTKKKDELMKQLASKN